jgi:hypothetical protein
VATDLDTQQAMPVVGYLRSASAADSAHIVMAFRQGLQEASFVEGQNVAIEFRWADNNLDRLPALVGELANPAIPNTVSEKTDVLAAAQTIGQPLVTVDVTSERQFEPAFATLVERGVGALFVGSGGFLNSKHQHIVALAARHKLPESYVWREAAVAGGLMS